MIIVAAAKGNVFVFSDFVILRSYFLQGLEFQVRDCKDEPLRDIYSCCNLHFSVHIVKGKSSKLVLSRNLFKDLGSLKLQRCS